MRHRSTSRGFTLIEMIVSIGLFSLVMLVVTAAYLTIIALDREARTTNEVVANLSFATESMARNIRTGTQYSCAGAGNGSCSQFSFRDADGQQITYLLKNDGTIAQCSSGTCTPASISAVSLTDPRIKIQSLTFLVRGVGTGEATPTQPWVVINIRGTLAGNKGHTVDFSVQTGATQRLLEL